MKVLVQVSYLIQVLGLNSTPRLAHRARLLSWFLEEQLVDYDIVGVYVALGQLLDEPLCLIEREELGYAHAHEGGGGGVTELSVHLLNGWKHLLQPPRQEVRVEGAIRPASKHTGHTVDHGAQLVLQPQQLPQAFLHHGREGQQPESMSCRCCIKDDNTE